MRRWFDPAASGLYVHVPFCASLCGYCDFFRVVSPWGVPEGFEALLLEDAARFRDVPPLKVDTVFLGGGTPSLLGPVRLGRLLCELGGIFEIDPNAEITLEANPETVNEASLGGWREAGVSRLSIGVQSLAPGVLAALERRASAATALAAVELAARSGFEHLSADIMSGVPGQAGGDLEDTVERMAALPLDHLSVYSLDLHPKTPLWEAVAAGKRTLPGEDDAADQFLKVHELLRERGFEHYEVSNYARPGGRSRHNLRTWQGGDTIGLGPSAWSRFKGDLWGNPRGLEAWTRAVRTDAVPPESAERLTPEREREDRVIFGLRVSDGTELRDVAGLLAVDHREAEVVLKPLLVQGYAVIEGSRLTLTVQGFLMSNEVLTYLLPRSWPRSPGPI